MSEEMEMNEVFMVCVGDNCLALRNLEAVKALLDQVFAGEVRKQLTIDKIGIADAADVERAWRKNGKELGE